MLAEKLSLYAGFRAVWRKLRLKLRPFCGGTK